MPFNRRLQHLAHAMDSRQFMVTWKDDLSVYFKLRRRAERVPLLARWRDKRAERLETPHLETEIRLGRGAGWVCGPSVARVCRTHPNGGWVKADISQRPPSLTLRKLLVRPFVHSGQKSNGRWFAAELCRARKRGGIERFGFLRNSFLSSCSSPLAEKGKSLKGKPRACSPATCSPIQRRQIPPTHSPAM